MSEGQGGKLDQSEVERLMEAQSGDRSSRAEAGEADADAPAAAAEAATPHLAAAAGGPPGAGGGGGMGDIEFLLNQAQAALASAQSDSPDLPDGVRSFALKDLSGSPASSEAATLDLLREVQLDVRIELGRTHMYLEEVLKLKKGAVVPLDKLAGDPVDIYVNGRLIARGEVLVLNDNFCVRVTELIVGDGANN